MKKQIAIAVFLITLCIPPAARAAVTSVTLVPAPPTTLSNGRSYYCAGRTYSFRVQATDPAATGKAYWNQIVVQIRQGLAVQQSFVVTIGAVPGWGALNGVEGINITDNAPASYTIIDYTIEVRFRWDATFFSAGANSVRAQASEDGGTSAANVKNFNFGVISRIQVINFAQNGDAADGRVNPWHEAFDVTGRVAYYSSAAEIITDSVPAAHITSVDLWWVKTAGPGAPDSGDTGETDLDAGDAFRYNIDAEYFFTGPGGSAAMPSTAPLGAYRWEARVTMVAAGGAPESPINTLSVICSRVQVTAVTFQNGGGANNPPYYHRSVNHPGTQIRVTAGLEYGGPGMAGNTTFVVTDNAAGGSHTYTVQIPGGGTVGTVLVNPVPDGADVGAGATVPITCTVDMIYGGAYDGNLGASGQNVAGRIVQPAAGAANRICYWDNADPPGDGGVTFTTETQTPASSATSFTLYWAALTADGSVDGDWDADFDSYRIYYRQGADPWTMVDRVGLPALGNIATVTASVTGLQPLTDYEYRLTAVDLFGNEAPNWITGFVTTAATQVDVTVTDGIATYQESHFDNGNPAARPVRDAAVTVTVRITTAGNLPDEVNLIIANNDSDVLAQWGSGANDDILALPAGARWSIGCAKTGPNTWQGFIPSEHPLMKLNTNIRFIAETVEGGVSTYVDHTDEAAPPGDHTASEWRFRVETKTLFLPWPTRVLNNVLTRQLPCCFPAYFLTLPALVTIKVYDIKGRAIAIIADRQFRPGGQNIKDMGWCGTNKDNRRVGPGLYYLHIKAVTLGDRVILDKIMKVVVRH